MYPSNPGEEFHVYLAHDSISNTAIENLCSFCERHGSRLYAIEVSEDLFANAIVMKRYPRAMYYRLLACRLLPGHIERVLYLDPDIVIINPVRELYDTPMGENLFAAAIHPDVTGITKPVNQIRLGQYEAQGYYNTGVLLFNLTLQRTEVREDDIFAFIEKYNKELILPDQDVFNALYGARTLPVDDSYYNYDTRMYEAYYIMSGGEKNLDWVMNHTVVLHFCGKAKPWLKSSRSRFAVLYKHYAAMLKREEG
ncbi:glycosyltransferase family 8 protein [Ruminococcaceae bacterium OttesenSCG-928-N02]|nr:glycosyltransferase family 8 protein [Ruminococcaceae bacterium OttesenSCG-928-N02]